MIKFLTAQYLCMRKIKGVVLNLQLPLNAIPRTAPDTLTEMFVINNCGHG